MNGKFDDYMVLRAGSRFANGCDIESCFAKSAHDREVAAFVGQKTAIGAAIVSQ